MAAWTDEEVAALGLPTYDEFRERFPGRTYDAWYNKRTTHRPGRKAVAHVPRVALSDEDYLKATIAYQHANAGAFPSDRVVDVSLETDQPIAVAFPSDWHIGSKGVNLQRLWDDCRLIAAHPRLYVAVGGDPVDNFGPGNHPDAAESQITDRASQWRIFRYLVELLHDSGSLLWVSSGNHDAWTHQWAGIDGISAALRGIPVAHTGEGALVRLRVGEHTYRIYRKHRPTRWKSGDNPTHFLRQMLMRGTPWEFDIGVSEHIHQAEICTFEWRPGSQMDRIAICCGSYKERDDFAEGLGYYGGGYGVPTVILNPRRREMLAFTSIRHAINVLDGVSVLAA